MAGDHGGGEAALLHAQGVDDPSGQRPAAGVHMHLLAQFPGRPGRIVDRRWRREREADSPHALEEGVAGEVIGSRAGGRRRRIEHGHHPDGRARRGDGHARLQGDANPDRGLARVEPADPIGRQRQAGATLPWTGDVDDEGLHGPHAQGGGDDGGSNPLRAKLGGGKPTETKRDQGQGDGDAARQGERPADGDQADGEGQGAPGQGRSRLLRKGEIKRRAQTQGDRGPQAPAVRLGGGLDPQPDQDLTQDRGEARRRPIAHAKTPRAGLSRRPVPSHSRNLNVRPPRRHPYRPFPHRLHAHRHGPDRAFQLAICAPYGWDLPVARGGHRPGAVHRGRRAGDL